MRRRRFVLAALSAAALASPLVTTGQGRARRARVGVLACDSSSTRVYDGFRNGMRALGHIDGTNIAIEWRFADGRYDRLGPLAEGLLKSNVDVVVAGTTLGVQAVYKTTKTVPIVMVAVPDPVGEGFAASLSRPGGNITGLSNIVTEISSKHVELLIAAVPRLSRIAVLLNPQNPSDSLILEQIQGTAYARGIKVQPVEASTAAGIDAAFAAMGRAKSESLIVAADAYFDVERIRIAEAALKLRLPLISSNREITEAGGMMSYGQDLADHFRRAASYVDRILSGSQPGEMPIEQPTVLELTLNQRSMASLGLAIPHELRLRADRVIG